MGGAQPAPPDTPAYEIMVSPAREESSEYQEPLWGCVGQGSCAQAQHACIGIQACTPAWDCPIPNCFAAPIAAGCAACRSNRGELAFYKLCVCVQIKQMVRVFTLALSLEVLR